MFYVYKSKFNVMYAVSFIYTNLSPHCFPFSSFQGMFFISQRTMDFFCRYHCQWLSFPWNLSISSLPMSVTTLLDCCYHWQFNPKHSCFHHLAGEYWSQYLCMSGIIDQGYASVAKRLCYGRQTGRQLPQRGGRQILRVFPPSGSTSTGLSARRCRIIDPGQFFMGGPLTVRRGDIRAVFLKYWLPSTASSTLQRTSPPGQRLPPRPGSGKICRSCTGRSSGCGSPVDCYILSFLRHSSSHMSATAPSCQWFTSKLLNSEIVLSTYIVVLLSQNNGIFSP